MPRGYGEASVPEPYILYYTILLLLARGGAPDLLVLAAVPKVTSLIQAEQRV